MSNPINIAVVGATTLVGETVIQLLEDRGFPVGELFPLADAEGAGGRVEFKGRHLRVTSWERFDFASAQLVLCCAGPEVARRLVPEAVDAGCLVIDQSSAFRQDPEVPLVVPEANAEFLEGLPGRIVASPSCVAIALAVVLKPLHDAAGIERVHVTTLQAVSGRGKEGVEELATQTVALLNLRPVEPKVFDKQIAFNVHPQIEALDANGYSGEEMKIVHELQRILGEPDLAVHATAIRVPVFHGHSAAVHVTTRRPLDVEEARSLLNGLPAIAMLDEEAEEPTPVTEATGQDAIWVGRLRQDLIDPRGFAFWLTTDNLRKGGALNVVQIAESMTKDHLDA